MTSKQELKSCFYWLIYWIEWVFPPAAEKLRPWSCKEVKRLRWGRSRTTELHSIRWSCFCSLRRGHKLQEPWGAGGASAFRLLTPNCVLSLRNWKEKRNRPVFQALSPGAAPLFNACCWSQSGLHSSYWSAAAAGQVHANLWASSLFLSVKLWFSLWGVEQKVTQH